MISFDKRYKDIILGHHIYDFRFPFLLWTQSINIIIQSILIQSYYYKERYS